MKARYSMRIWLAITIAILLVAGLIACMPKAEQRGVRENIGFDSRVDSYFYNSASLMMYSDDHSTQKFAVAGSSGNIDTEGTLDVNSTSDLKGNVADSGGAFTIADNTLIDGAADAVQLTVQGYTTQTSNLIVAETSAGTDKFTVDNSGNVAVAGTSDLVGNVSDSGGALTVADNTLIDGAADAVQLTVQGYTTQTNNLLVAETSAGTDKFTVDNSGNVAVAGTLGVTDKATLSGETVLASIAITPANGSTLTAGASFYIVNSSTDVTFTLGTSGASSGQMLMLYGDDANTITVADTNIRTSDGNALTLGQYDMIVTIFNGTDWIEWLKLANQ